MTLYNRRTLTVEQKARGIKKKFTGLVQCSRSMTGAFTYYYYYKCPAFHKIDTKLLGPPLALM